MKHRSAQRESNSLKTFFLYTALVFFVILISLSIKTYFIIKNSVFDGKNQFVLAVAYPNREVKEIFSFDPRGKEVGVLQLRGEPLYTSSLGKTLGLIPNATIQVPSEFSSNGEAIHLLTEMIVKPRQFTTPLTIYDSVRLWIFAQNTKTKKETVAIPTNQQLIDTVIKQLFSNNTIIAEDVTIQILNASGASGLGTRLERVLSNMGAQVISVKTSHSREIRSIIRFYGEETETVRILTNLLTFPVQQMDREGVARVIITIGEDNKNVERF